MKNTKKKYKKKPIHYLINFDGPAACDVKKGKGTYYVSVTTCKKCLKALRSEP